MVSISGESWSLSRTFPKAGGPRSDDIMVCPDEKNFATTQENVVVHSSIFSYDKQCCRVLIPSTEDKNNLGG